MELIYLDYGGHLANQMQTHFSILSVLAHSATPPCIHVVTDTPAAYQHLAKYVDTLQVDRETLQAWRGEKDYSFRIKLMAIQHAVRQLIAQRPESAAFMFIDSDTFALCDLMPFWQAVEKGLAYMNKNEGMPFLTHGPSLRLWKAVEGKSYAGIAIDQTSEMWNSGILALPALKALDVCDLAIRLCDEMLADGVRSFNVEQFCFTLALRHHCQEIHSAEPYFCHYWGNKAGWNRVQADFFVKSYMEEHTLEQDIQAFRDIDLTSTPYHLKSPIWRDRFLRWTDRIAPLKDHRYLRK